MGTLEGRSQRGARINVVVLKVEVRMDENWRVLPPFSVLK